MDLTQIKLSTYIFLLLLSFAPTSSVAADFSNAKKTYVPPSQIQRRPDFASLREQASVQSLQSARHSGPKHFAQNHSIAKLSSTHTSIGHNTAKITNNKKNKLPSNKELIYSNKEPVNPKLISNMSRVSNKLVQTGRLDEAQRVLAKLYQFTPQDTTLVKQLSSVSLRRARQYLARNDFADALQATRQALANDPGNTEGLELLNQLYRRFGLDPQNINVRLKIAQALYRQMQYEEAAVEYRSSLVVKPTAQAYVGLGKVAEKLQVPGSSKIYYEEALRVDPNSIEAHKELGMLYYNTGDLTEANIELSRVLMLNPYDKEIGQTLVKLWQNQVSRAPGANSRLGLARAYQLTGDLQAAKSQYQQVAQLDPNNPYLPAARQSFQLALARQAAQLAPSMIAAIPQANNSTALSYAPYNNVATLSSFTGQLRYSMLTEKAKSQQFEDANRQMLKNIIQSNSSNQQINSSVSTPNTPTEVTLAQIANEKQWVQSELQQLNPTAGTLDSNKTQSIQSALLSKSANPIPVAPNIAHSVITNKMSPLPQNINTATVAPASSIALSSGANNQLALRGPIGGATTTNLPLRFELVESSVKRDYVLQVVLYNDSDHPLALPDKLKVVVRDANQHETPVKVAFAGTTVPAHGVLPGTIHMPIKKADSNADVILSNLFPNTAPHAELHLVRALSQK